MTNNPHSGRKVPTERPDPEAAGRDPRPGSRDRPGFDLGGISADNATEVGSNTVPGGPKGSAAGSGKDGPTGGSGGVA